MATVELERVRKSYGDFVAVDDLSFSISPGQIFGLLGPNGAGKTSSIRMMIGIMRPDAGVVRLFGEPFERRHLRKIGYLPEERGLYRKITVRENLALFGQLSGLTSRDAIARARRWAERLGIAEWIDKRVEELSKGMQQKVQFIAALLHDPELIIMDEPFAGLDPINANVLKDVILDLKKQGRTILFSTHRMDQVEKLCDSICLINRGRAVLQGGLREIKASYGAQFVQIAYEGDGKVSRTMRAGRIEQQLRQLCRSEAAPRRRFAGSAARRDARRRFPALRSWSPRSSKSSSTGWKRPMPSGALAQHLDHLQARMFQADSHPVISHHHLDDAVFHGGDRRASGVGGADRASPSSARGAGVPATKLAGRFARDWQSDTKGIVITSRSIAMHPDAERTRLLSDLNRTASTDYLDGRAVDEQGRRDLCASQRRRPDGTADGSGRDFRRIQSACGWRKKRSLACGLTIACSRASISTR